MARSMFDLTLHGKLAVRTGMSIDARVRESFHETGTVVSLAVGGSVPSRALVLY